MVSTNCQPALVETKLSYNPEQRREVVAQLLDYALGLQGQPLDELPMLPAYDPPINPEDLRDCLSKGNFSSSSLATNWTHGQSA